MGWLETKISENGWKVRGLGRGGGKGQRGEVGCGSAAADFV